MKTRQRGFEATRKRWKLVIALGWLATLTTGTVAGGGVWLEDAAMTEAAFTWLGCSVMLLTFGKLGAWWFHG